MGSKQPSKLQLHGVPWAAVIVAVLGWYDARGGATAAQKKAHAAQVQVSSSQEWSEGRAEKAWKHVQRKFERQQERLDELEAWVVELEDFVETQAEVKNPRSRERHLAVIRDSQRARAVGKMLAAPDVALPDYDLVHDE